MIFSVFLFKIQPSLAEHAISLQQHNHYDSGPHLVYFMVARAYICTMQLYQKTKKKHITSEMCLTMNSSFASHLFFLVEQHQLAVCENAVLPLPWCCLGVGWLTTRQTMGGWSFYVCIAKEKNKLTNHFHTWFTSIWNTRFSKGNVTDMILNMNLKLL